MASTRSLRRSLSRASSRLSSKISRPSESISRYTSTNPSYLSRPFRSYTYPSNASIRRHTRPPRLSDLSSRYTSNLLSQRPPALVASLSRNAARQTLSPDPSATSSFDRQSGQTGASGVESTGLSQYFTREERDLISLGATDQVINDLRSSRRFENVDMLHGYLASVLSSSVQSSAFPHSTAGSVGSSSSAIPAVSTGLGSVRPPSYESVAPPRYSSVIRSSDGNTDDRSRSPTSRSNNHSAYSASRLSLAERGSRYSWSDISRAGRPTPFPSYPSGVENNTANSTQRSAARQQNSLDGSTAPEVIPSQISTPVSWYTQGPKSMSELPTPTTIHSSTSTMPPPSTAIEMDASERASLSELPGSTVPRLYELDSTGLSRGIYLNPTLTSNESMSEGLSRTIPTSSRSPTFRSRSHSQSGQSALSRRKRWKRAKGILSRYFNTDTGVVNGDTAERAPSLSLSSIGRGSPKTASAASSLSTNKSPQNRTAQSALSTNTGYTAASDEIARISQSFASKVAGSDWSNHLRTHIEHSTSPSDLCKSLKLARAISAFSAIDPSTLANLYRIRNRLDGVEGKGIDYGSMVSHAVSGGVVPFNRGRERLESFKNDLRWSSEDESVRCGSGRGGSGATKLGVKDVEKLIIDLSRVKRGLEGFEGWNDVQRRRVKDSVRYVKELSIHDQPYTELR